MLTLIFVFCGNTFANITLSKNRLFFDEKDRGDALQLRNTGGNPMQFKTELHLVKMDENGGISKVLDADDSAISMLRFSPRRGVVPAGGKQVIRFSVRRPKDLPEGEYRAVLSLSTSLATDRPEAVTLQSTLSYNMPIIVRHGETSAKTTLENTRLVNSQDAKFIELWQTLDGNRSLFGNFTVENEEGEVVGLLNGVAVYTPLAKRKVMIPIDELVAKETLTVKYQEVSAYGGIETAESRISL